ncbi:MAG: transcription antitermination factor NusB [bacterium]|nr:transcription antitermination factor NusB [Candidatus Sumerlaeota bacterium]
MSINPQSAKPVKRREARRLALLAQYAMECNGYAAWDTLGLMCAFKPEWITMPEFTRLLCQTTEDHKAEIEHEIASVLEHWKYDRIAIVERAILKLATAEILFFPDIPPRVTINEYIELSKPYGSDQAPAFINGILDRIVHLRHKADFHVKQAGKK